VFESVTLCKYAWQFVGITFEKLLGKLDLILENVTDAIANDAIRVVLYVL